MTKTITIKTIRTRIAAQLDATTFRRGQRVHLPANKREGWPDEYGIIEAIEPRGMLIVQLDERYVDGDDDGIREVHKSKVRHT